MTKEVKALLLNILVCPGGGQLLLGKTLLGWIIVLVAALSLMLMMSDILSVSEQIANEMLNGTIPLDPMALTSEVHQKIMATDLGWPFWLFLSTWAIGIADTARVLLTQGHSSDD